jgi:hypothetical protein
MYVFIYSFHYVCMTVHDLATLSGNERVTELQRSSTQGSIFSLFGVLCQVDSGRYEHYFIEEHLVVSVWVHEKTAQVR